MEINYEELKKVCLDFFRLAGMEFSLWDENKNNIYSYPDSHSPFCKAVRNTRTLFLKCQTCDRTGLEEVYRTKSPNIYRCHMGLTEAIVPIMQEEEIVGYLMLGQIAEEENREYILKCIDDNVTDEEFKNTLRRKLEETTSCSHDKTVYCMNTLKILIDYMNLSYIIRKPGENTFYLAKKYIVSNISKAVLPKDICKAIGVSANTLYKAVQKNTGLSTTAFIRKMKIEEAKRLLFNSSVGISGIAEQVGIPDVNYFIRVFKREEGVSPLRYRKLSIEKENTKQKDDENNSKF